MLVSDCSSYLRRSQNLVGAAGIAAEDGQTTASTGVNRSTPSGHLRRMDCRRWDRR